MADIHQDFPIKAPINDVFRAISTPAGLNHWWTLTSAGEPVVGVEYQLGFGPDFQWQAIVTKSVANREFELRISQADSDWLGSRVGFDLETRPEFTWVRFHHLGWPDANEHFRISNHCWAMYLRVLRRYLEHGETVDYSKRLDV